MLRRVSHQLDMSQLGSDRAIHTGTVPKPDGREHAAETNVQTACLSHRDPPR